METGHDQLKRNSEELALINQRQEERVNEYEKKTHYVTISFLISQLIIFSSISKPSSLRCSHWWIPFNLSLLCSTVYCIAFWHTLSKYVRTWYQLDLNRIEHEIIIRELHRASHSQVSYKETTTRPRELKPDSVVWARRYTFISIIVCALLTFAALMLYACRAFLCG